MLRPVILLSAAALSVSAEGGHRRSGAFVANLRSVPGMTWTTSSHLPRAISAPKQRPSDPSMAMSTEDGATGTQSGAAGETERKERLASIFDGVLQAMAMPGYAGMPQHEHTKPEGSKAVDEGVKTESKTRERAPRKEKSDLPEDEARAARVKAMLEKDAEMKKYVAGKLLEDENYENSALEESRLRVQNKDNE